MQTSLFTIHATALDQGQFRVASDDAHTAPQPSPRRSEIPSQRARQRISSEISSSTSDSAGTVHATSLVVLGRVSEVVRTAAGERFIPNFIENRIKFSSFVRNVAVIGADRNELTAIVCIDYDAVGHWAEQRALSYGSYADLSQLPQVQELVAGVLAHVNETQPQGLRIRRFVDLHKDFDADDGEITRTRKLRRNVIETTYAPLTEALYSGARQVEFDAPILYEDGRRGAVRRTLKICEVAR